MLSRWEKQCLKTFGVICTCCVSLLIFICLFLVGFDYRLTHQDWTSTGDWRHLGIVRVTAVVFAFAVIILGFITFTVASQSKPVIGIFVGIDLASAIFTLSIAIFALVGGTVGNFEDYIGCNTKYKRMLTYWRSIDQLMIEVDRYFCSTGCPCDVNTYVKRMFASDPFAKAMLGTSNVLNEPKFINFQSCVNKATVVDAFVKKDKDNWGESITDFDIDKFANMWGYIEDQFECSGWCTTAYQSDDTDDRPTGQRMIYKYLFSDVNKGIVKHKGCLKQILNFLPRTMLAYGSLTLIASIFQLLSFLMALALLLRNKEERGEVIPKTSSNKLEEDLNKANPQL